VTPMIVAFTEKTSAGGGEKYMFISDKSVR